MCTRPLKCLYALTLYLFILELLYPFTFLSQSPYAELLKAHTKFLSLTLEVGAVYFIYLINSWQLTTVLLLFPVVLLSKTLRMRLKYLKERASVLEAIAKANGASEPSTAYPILCLLFLLNGMLFNREEGSVILWGALIQCLEIYTGHSFVLLGMLVLMVPWGVFCCVSVILKGSSVPEEDLEKALVGLDLGEESMTVVDKSLMLGAVSMRV